MGELGGGAGVVGFALLLQVPYKFFAFYLAYHGGQM